MTMYKKLKSVRKGTTWPGLVVSGVTFNDAAPGSTLTDVKMSFKKNKNDSTTPLQLTILNAGLLITNATTWAFNAPKKILSLDVGVWHWDILATASNGDKFVILEGTLEIIQNIT